ncbi:MAG: hypothetical protein H5T64_10600 [Chloroflexi bacterium]|nr:hypothetical protein [Chloroflexota bacterium]
MHIEVDQSGKIGDTKVATVLAFSDTESYAILIPAEVKRACLHELRQRGKSGTTLYLQLFAVGLFLLLAEVVGRVSLVTIDIEYPGHSATTKRFLMNLFGRAGLSVDADMIEFRQIHGVGKKPAAHDKAYYVSRGDAKPDRVITLEELLEQFK